MTRDLSGFRTGIRVMSGSGRGVGLLGGSGRPGLAGHFNSDRIIVIVA